MTAAIISCGIVSNAQSAKSRNFQSHLSLGPVISLGHSWVTNIPADRDFKFAPAFGVGLVYSTNVHWGFGAQMLISHEGYKQEFKRNNNETVDVSVNPVYLRMPLQATYFFGEYGNRVRPKIYAGPSVAVRLDEVHYYSNENMLPSESSLVMGDRFSRFDAGLTVGAGLNIRVGRAMWLNMDGGYYHGLVDVIPDYGDYNANRNLRFNAGLMWGL